MTQNIIIEQFKIVKRFHFSYTQIQQKIQEIKLY